MKDSTETIFWILLFLDLLFMKFMIQSDFREIGKKIEPTIIHDTVYVETPSQWDSLISALIDVESNGNPMAVNASSGATGVLQITEIFVAETNRILGEERYTLDDRFDEIKSIEMFNILQGHHNPTRDIDKAIRLHNPNGGEAYMNKVKARVNYPLAKD